MIGYLLEGQTHASMPRCASNASARVVYDIRSGPAIRMQPINQSINMCGQQCVRTEGHNII
jgi:hypothetical protein